MLTLTTDSQAALDRAKQAVPEGGELEIGLLFASLYHSTPLKERLPERLGAVLTPPDMLRTTVPARVPVAESLQTVLAQLQQHDRPVTPEIFFATLLDSPSGQHWLQSAGLSEEELGAVRASLNGWRSSPERRAAIKALNSYGRMLTATEPPYKGVAGMEKYLRALLLSLSTMRNRAAILVGHPGTGKSAIVYELARQLYHGSDKIPPHLRDLDLFELSPVFLRSGASVVGEYDERVKALLQVLEVHPKIVLFIDEIHSLFKSSIHERDPFSDANEAFKSKLTGGTIACIGCTTDAEYHHYIEPDAALARRFTVIRVDAPTPEATLAILQARRPRMEEYFAPPPLRIPDETLKKAIDLTEDYLPGRAQPAKSLRLLDQACAWCVTAESRPEQVTEAALLSALEDMIGHSVVRPEALTEDGLYQQLTARIIGQDGTLRRVARGFVAGLGGWGQRSGPRGVYFFCGPTGVGKTETAVLLGRLLGGGGEALVRVNCNVLQGAGNDAGPAINVLLGAPPGYVGYVRGQGGLLSKVRDTPECIVLFDEIEKADPGVAKVLLQIMDTGRAEDNDGNLLDFRRAYLIFTTNAGAVYEHHAIGFVADTTPADDTPDADPGGVMNELRGLGFGEEFFGRVDEFFVFHGLRAEPLRRIVELQLQGLKASADVRGYELVWDAAVIDYLATRWQPRFGVRHLTTILRHRIVEHLSVAEAQRELDGVRRIELRALANGVADPTEDLAGLAHRERDGDTLRINLA